MIEISKHKLDHTTMGICVSSLKDNQIVYVYNAEKLLIPASNLKLFTAATVLNKLGGNYRFRTKVYADGRLNSKGVLKGDLYLKGFGDPTLVDQATLEVWHSVQGAEHIYGNPMVLNTLWKTWPRSSKKRGYGRFQELL